MASFWIVVVTGSPRVVLLFLFAGFARLGIA